MHGDNRWDSWDTAKRLRRLSRREGEIIWAPAAGFVRARRLLSERGLWEFTPLSGSKWSWLMAGSDPEVRWKVTFADGRNEPMTIADGIYDAEGALIEAVDFLGWDNSVREHELAPEPAPEELGALLAAAEIEARQDDPTVDVRDQAVQTEPAPVEAHPAPAGLEPPARRPREIGGGGYEM